MDIAKRRNICTPVKKWKRQRILSPKKYSTLLPEDGNTEQEYGCSNTSNSRYVRTQSARYIQCGRITKGLRFLFENNSSAVKAIPKILYDIFAREVNSIINMSESEFSKDIIHTNLSDFSWTSAVKAAQHRAPTLVGALQTMLPFVAGGKTRGRRKSKR